MSVNYLSDSKSAFSWKRIAVMLAAFEATAKINARPKVYNVCSASAARSVARKIVVDPGR